MRSIYRLLILGAFLYHSQLSAAIPINASSPEPEAITQGKLTITGVVIDKRITAICCRHGKRHFCGVAY